MDILWVFSVLRLLCICRRLYICALWSPAGKGLTSWLSFVVSNCEFVTFPFGIMSQVWYLIVFIPGANFINKVRTIYLKLCVRCFLRIAYVSFIKTS